MCEEAELDVLLLLDDQFAHRTPKGGHLFQEATNPISNALPCLFKILPVSPLNSRKSHYFEQLELLNSALSIPTLKVIARPSVAENLPSLACET